MPDPAATPPDQVLRAARVRRERLRSAMDALELALAGAAPSREADWRAHVGDAVSRLDGCWREHVRETEADDGAFGPVLAHAPRLTNAVDRLRGDHDEVPGMIERLRDHAAAGHDVTAVREEALALFARLARHRQMGADLLYEAYSVDIGTGE